MQNIFLLAVIFYFTQISYAQNVHQYSVEELQEDYQELRDHIETKNPIAYLYQSQEVVTAYLDGIEKDISKPMTELDFYRLISPVSSLIKDGHNFIMPSPQTISYIKNHPHILPLEMAFLENDVFVLNNYSENNVLDQKYKIHSINDVSIEFIIKKFYLVLPREGLQTQLTKNYINKWFRFLYHLHFGFKEEYKIQYSHFNNEIKEVSIKGLALDEMNKRKDILKNTVQKNKGISIELVEYREKTLLLKVPSFAPSVLKETHSQADFKKEIDRCFDAVLDKNVEHLIIDLRENNGGNPMYSVFLLKYLMDKPFVHAIEGRVVKDAEKETVLERTKKKWYPWYGIGQFKPKKKHYSGKIYVLIGGGTFSAAVEFCSILKKYKRATFIGEETGGNPIVMSGNYLKANRSLKNTNITHSSGNICTIYDELEKNDGRGIIPDYAVVLDIDDLTLERDVFMDRVVRYIQLSSNK